MRSWTCLLLIAGSSLLSLSCKTQTSTAQIDAKSDACSILSSDDVSSIQGEKVVQAERSQSTSGDTSSRRCFYRTENFNRSVDLEIISAANGARGVSEFWNKRFHTEHKTEEEEEEEAARAKSSNSTSGERDEEEDRAKAAPSPVGGIGEEAFWVSNQLNSTLYVLQNGSVVRISIGGPDPAEQKLQRARSMAEKILSPHNFG